MIRVPDGVWNEGAFMCVTWGGGTVTSPSVVISIAGDAWFGSGIGVGALGGEGGWIPSFEMISWRRGLAGGSWGDAGAGVRFANGGEASGVSFGPAMLC